MIIVTVNPFKARAEHSFQFTCKVISLLLNSAVHDTDTYYLHCDNLSHEIMLYNLKQLSNIQKLLDSFFKK